MNSNHKNTLSGKDNKRLDQSTPTRKEGTAAWSEEKELLKTSNVAIPSQPSVENAKEWVDNGSRL